MEHSATSHPPAAPSAIAARKPMALVGLQMLASTEVGWRLSGHRPDQSGSGATGAANDETDRWAKFVVAFTFPTA
ncbi:hypothetical protein GCM10009646_68480 [Streptomyces aureus]